MHPNREELGNPFKRLIFIPFPFLYCLLLCFLYRICLFVCVLSCDFMLKTLRTMFELSVGGVNNLFLHEFRGIYSPITYNVVSCCFKRF